MINMNGKIINNDDSVTLDKFLQNSYEKLWKSIQKEDYNLDFLNFNEFHEIIHENEVVGFIAMENLKQSFVKIIVECYILPDARGNKLVYESLIDIMSNTCFKVISKKPTLSFIQALISYGWAYKINSNLVFSWIPFDLRLSDAYKNSNIKRLYKNLAPENENTICFGQLFDLNNYCILFKDHNYFFSKDPNTYIISEPRKYDIKKYNCRRKLKKVTPNYLEDINFEMANNIFDALNYFMELNKSLSEQFTVDKIIGSEDKLNDDVIYALKNNNLSIEDGFKIRQAIVGTVESGEILNTSIGVRFAFLMENFDFIERTVDVGGRNSLDCPFCHEYNPNISNSCVFCGHEFGEVINPFEFVDDMNSLEDDFQVENDDFLDDDNISTRNHDFLTQFNDFNEKFNDFFGDDLEKLIESIRNEDYDGVDELLNKDKSLEKFDWYFKEDLKVDNGLLRIIEENDYNMDEVYSAQSRIYLYEYVKYVNDNIVSWKADSLQNFNHILFDAPKQALNQGLIKKIMSDKFGEYFDKYSKQDLIKELEYFDIQPENSKKEIINQLSRQGEFLYALTDDGLNYLNSNPLLEFFANNLEEFLFFEFEKFYNDNKDNYTTEEIANKFVNNTFKKSVKSGNLDDYLKYLDYYYKINFNNQNYDQSLIYLIQRVIYEVNKWHTKQKHRPFEFALSIKTGNYFQNISDLNETFDLKKIYDNAFDEFKFGHMKDNKKEIYDFIEDMVNGLHFMLINEYLIDKYSDN